MPPNTRGLVSALMKLQSEEVKRLVEDALWTQGVRGKLDANKRHQDFQTDHGFRIFKTRCELSNVSSLHIEILMNHSIGSLLHSLLRPLMVVSRLLQPKFWKTFLSSQTFRLSNYF